MASNLLGRANNKATIAASGARAAQLEKSLQAGVQGMQDLLQQCREHAQRVEWETAAREWDELDAQWKSEYDLDGERNDYDETIDAQQILPQSTDAEIKLEDEKAAAVPEEDIRDEVTKMQERYVFTQPFDEHLALTTRSRAPRSALNSWLFLHRRITERMIEFNGILDDMEERGPYLVDGEVSEKWADHVKSKSRSQPAFLVHESD